MKDSSYIINQIKQTAKSFLPNSKIILFGSRARKEENDESDYDILIITETTIDPKEKFPVRTKIRKALLKYNILSDILIQSDEEIKRKKNLPGHIIRTIINEGICL